MIPETIKTWHSLVEQKDPLLLDDIVADDAVFYSPVVHTPQIGKDITKLYLTAALHVLCNSSFTYVREIYNEHHAVLEFETEIDGISLNGVDIISWNDQGEISEFKVMIRPLKAINLLHSIMADMLVKMKKE